MNSFFRKNRIFSFLVKTAHDLDAFLGLVFCKVEDALKITGEWVNEIYNNSGIPYALGVLVLWYVAECLGPTDRFPQRMLFGTVIFSTAFILLFHADYLYPSAGALYHSAYLVALFEITTGGFIGYHFYRRVLNSMQFPENKTVLVLILLLLFSVWVLVSGNLLVTYAETPREETYIWGEEVRVFRQQVCLGIFCLLLVEGYLRFAAPLVSPGLNRIFTVLLWVVCWQCFLHLTISVWYMVFPNVPGSLLVTYAETPREETYICGEEVHVLHQQVCLGIFCLLLAEGYLRFAAPLVSPGLNKIFVVLLWVACLQCFLHFTISVWYTAFPNVSHMEYMYQLNILLANHALTWFAVEVLFGALFSKYP